MYDHVREMSECSDGVEDEGGVEDEDGVEDEEDEDLIFPEQEEVGWPKNKVLVEPKMIYHNRHN